MREISKKTVCSICGNEYREYSVCSGSSSCISTHSFLSDAPGVKSTCEDCDNAARKRSKVKEVE